MRRAGHVGTAPAVIALAAALTVPLASCAVPDTGTVRAVEPADVPYRLLDPAPGPVGAPPAEDPVAPAALIYLLDQADLLVPRPQPGVVGGPAETVGAVLARLAAGPTEAERTDGFASALGPGAGLALVDLAAGTAVIEVTTADAPPAADRLPLAVGQVVLSVTSVEGVDRVLLLQDGQPVEAPLPGGERTALPVTAADYRVLVRIGPVAGT